MTYNNIRELSCREYKPFPISAIERKYKTFGEFRIFLENNKNVADLEDNLNKLINGFIHNADI